MKQYSLEKACVKITDGSHFSPKDTGNGYPMLSVKDMDEYGFNRTACKYISYEDFEKLKKQDCVPRKNDILVAKDGSYLKHIFICEEDREEGILSSIAIFRPNTAIVEPRYLMYLLKSPQVFNDVKNNYVSGSALPRIVLKDFKKVRFNIPSLAQQNKVVEILSPIDRKIRLNQQINNNLAEQAQGVLYHFMDKYLYQLKPLSDLAVVIDCLHSKKPSAKDDGTYQLIQLDNIRDDGFLDMSARKYMISKSDYENWTRKCEIVEGDCVITNVGRIGAVSQAPYGTKAAMGRNMTCIRLKSGLQLQSYFITVLLSKHMRRQVQSNTDEGTIMGALNVKNIPKLLFPVFDDSVMSELESILFPLRKQIEYNNLQNQNLTQTRDILLPKLMSGEIDVSDIQL